MSWNTGDSHFHVKTENFVAAQEALDKALGLTYDGSLCEGLKRAGWDDVYLDDHGADIVGLELSDSYRFEADDCDGKHFESLRAIAPFVERGSYVRMFSDEADSHWLGVCLRFDGKGMAENDLTAWTVEENSVEDMMETLQSVASILIKLGASLDDMLKAVSEAGVEGVMEE